MKKKGQRKNGNEDGPTMIVGGVAMPWGDFQKMIREMDGRQKPFKAWIKKDLLPAYGKHLEEHLSERVTDRHWDVADLFFERVLHVGFLRYEEIRPEFAFIEFPRWWGTHVIGMPMTTAQVRSSLRKLSEFVRVTYGISMNGKPKS